MPLAAQEGNDRRPMEPPNAPVPWPGTNRPAPRAHFFTSGGGASRTRNTGRPRDKACRATSDAEKPVNRFKSRSSFRMVGFNRIEVFFICDALLQPPTTANNNILAEMYDCALQCHAPMRHDKENLSIRLGALRETAEETARLAKVPLSQLVRLCLELALPIVRHHILAMHQQFADLIAAESQKAKPHPPPPNNGPSRTKKGPLRKQRARER